MLDKFPDNAHLIFRNDFAIFVWWYFAAFLSPCFLSTSWNQFHIIATFQRVQNLVAFNIGSLNILRIWLCYTFTFIFDNRHLWYPHKVDGEGMTDFFFLFCPGFLLERFFKFNSRFFFFVFLFFPPAPIRGSCLYKVSQMISNIKNKYYTFIQIK